MVRRQNYQRRNNYQGNESQGSSQNNPGLENTQAESRGRQHGAHGGSNNIRLTGSGGSQQANRSGGYERPYQQRHRYSQEYGNRRDNNQSRERSHSRGPNRDSTSRQSSYSSQSSFSKINEKVKVEETVEDIKADILRLEKEIRLEIKEIRSLKLGL